MPLPGPPPTKPHAVRRCSYVAAHRCVRVRRIDHELGAARVVAEVQRLRPRLAAVGRHEDAALRIRSVEMSHRRDPDDVRVLRMDDHARDRVRVAQADVLELDVGGVRRERVRALPDAVAERARLAVVRFAGADVEDVRIGRARARGRRSSRRRSSRRSDRRSCRCSSCARRR